VNDEKARIEYLANWYIGVGQRRGWDEVKRLIDQYPEDAEKVRERMREIWKSTTRTKQ
jgi:predicted nucleotidyltransferase